MDHNAAWAPPALQLPLPEELNARAMAARWLRAVASILAGAATGLVEFGYLMWTVFAAALQAVPGPHRKRIAHAVDEQAIRLTGMELRRVTRFHGPVHTDVLTPKRCRRYLSLRWMVGGLGLGVLLMLLLCFIVAGSMLSAWIFDGGWGFIENSDNRVDTWLVVLAALPGTMLTFVSAAGILGVGTLDRWLATEALGTSPQALLQQRVVELTNTRAEVIEAINDERRRIERDLHDGVQQRLVALGMLVGRARRAAAGADPLRDLLEQAQVAAQEAISELREVASRVYPVGLDDAGLHAALESLAERSSVAIRLDFQLTERLRSTLETAVYFVVSEAVTNAAKHANASLVEVSVARRDDRVHVVIRDDGVGGADPTGTGLSGLARRVAAVDGLFSVRSPRGGPTEVEASLPCA
ncbi:sensor histidine kinase [Actinokineospora iranica]|uniref:histidine kinase n=1 Tax=Actinokineospora iranica TaxID=1271860 RepID=A0A1G6U4X4_9PSEU|nr:sensor histidine kinase [Actinokineospora iranica]SDD36343.1 Signal transduction histidine kinase [Actinokineospora iranica]